MTEHDHHPAEEMDGLWSLVEETLAEAKAMHYDGCHKIYLSMDDDEVKASEACGFEAVPPDLAVIRGWYENACPLRFISAVHTNRQDPNAGFVRLIPQGY